MWKARNSAYGCNVFYLIINYLNYLKDYFIPNSIHATSCHYFRWYGYTHVSLEKFTGWVCYLDMIDTSKTCLVKWSLAEWKSEIENVKSEFFVGFKRLVTCIFNVLNLKPANIGLNSSHKENKFKSSLTKQLWYILLYNLLPTSRLRNP